jgi:hypothetical protein
MGRDFRDPVQVEMRRHRHQVWESLQRASALLKVSARLAPAPAEEIRRAAVVLMHAYLEDFLRTIAGREFKAFSNAKQIEQFLNKLDFAASEHSQHLAAIDRMIKRRHRIVHHADKAVAPSNDTLQPLRDEEVVDWLIATCEFAESLMRPLERKLAAARNQKRKHSQQPSKT